VKHRFLSKDDVHSHFRMAAFAQGSYSRHYLQYDEIDLNADMSGFQAGLIATQLKNKFAASAAVSFIKAIDNKRLHPEHFVKQIKPLIIRCQQDICFYQKSIKVLSSLILIFILSFWG